MSAKLLFSVFAVAGIAPAVLWAFASIITTVFSIVYRPISFSFRLYANASSTSAFHFHELPVLPAVCILVGGAILLFGLFSIPRLN